MITSTLLFFWLWGILIGWIAHTIWAEMRDD